MSKTCSAPPTSNSLTPPRSQFGAAPRGCCSPTRRDGRSTTTDGPNTGPTAEPRRVASPARHPSTPGGTSTSPRCGPTGSAPQHVQKTLRHASPQFPPSTYIRRSRESTARTDVGGLVLCRPCRRPTTGLTRSRYCDSERAEVPPTWPPPRSGKAHTFGGLCRSDVRIDSVYCSPN